MPQSQEIYPYRERVLPGLLFYAATLVFPGALFLISLPFGEELAYLVVLGSILSIFGLSWLSSPVIFIDQKTLHLGKAVIPRELLSKATVISSNESFAAKGRNLDMKAFVRFQPAVKGLVKVELSDPNDPTPYWLFSTRNPEIIVERINRR